MSIALNNNELTIYFELSEFSKPIRKELKIGQESHEITKAVAIKALKSIERSSKLKSIVKPTLIVLTGIALFAGGIALAVFAPTLPMLALAVALFVVGHLGAVFGGFFAALGGIISYTEENDRAEHARRLINKLETADDRMHIILPTPGDRFERRRGEQGETMKLIRFAQSDPLMLRA